MKNKVHPRRPRKIKPTIESLEDRNLLTVSPVQAIPSSGTRALLESIGEMARRHDHASIGSGDHRDGNDRHIGVHATLESSHAARGTIRVAQADGRGRHRSSRASYDVAIPLSYVGSPGNASVAINGFVPPSSATVPATIPNGGAYQHIGGVPYVYAIGQTEITAGQYVTFLNKVDPQGDNPVQPFTGVRLWTNAFSPVTNPFSGEINLVANAAPGTHYQLAAPYWANKPLVNGNLLDFAYFANSLYNGSTVAVDNHRAKSPLGFRVQLQTRYVNLSTTISTGIYNLQDPSYPLFQRLGNSGYVIPSENEWIKAAYYSPRATGNGTNYYYYPTVSNNPPTSLQTGGTTSTVDGLGNVIQSNLAPGVAYSNYNQAVNWQPPYDPQPPTNGGNVVNVGEDHTPSPWLTYDQGGNVVEYTDTAAALVAGAPNPRDLPVSVKVHGGIANAATYQLWLTATGTSDPYGQQLGQTDTQGGARFGYLPDPHAHAFLPGSRRVSSSALAKPQTSTGLVYRLDNLNTLDTLYTTDLTKAISLASDPSTYVFLGASFQQPVGAGATPVYGVLNTTTRTHFYTTDPNEAARVSANPGFASEGIVFGARPPDVGSTNFRRFYNAQTGAYAYSAADADIQFFTSRGYQLNGDAWSVA